MGVEIRDLLMKLVRSSNANENDDDETFSYEDDEDDLADVESDDELFADIRYI